LKINLSNDKSRLVEKSVPWDFNNPPFDIVEMSEALVELLLEKKGLGLAYNQTDLPGNFSIFAMRGEPENFIVINPKIVQPSDETIELEEACLSFPGLIVPVTRARHVRVRFMAPDGQVYTKTFANLSARVFQHEFSHIQGLPFWNGISKLKFDRAIKKAYKKGFDYSHVTFKGI
jgi:peptide deformylase